ncbi:hypothetical protein B0H14DRAFT_2955133 [Mycena olivaceomarginata]|nr:hypothetical protein B0H14DRAFT_2955133 [Mycena olivaceomarginata]
MLSYPSPSMLPLLSQATKTPKKSSHPHLDRYLFAPGTATATMTARSSLCVYCPAFSRPKLSRLVLFLMNPHVAHVACIIYLIRQHHRVSLWTRTLISLIASTLTLHPPRIDAGTLTSTGSQSSAIHHPSAIPPLYCIIVGLITSSFIRIIDTLRHDTRQSLFTAL